MKLRPSIVTLEGAFYYQMGKEEHGIPLDAFMGSVKLKVTLKENYDLYAGYDYLSGDKYFAVPGQGMIGLVQHKKLQGFCPLFGSHHEFYGAMDFFYLDSYVSNFTPGLQNLFAGGSLNPYKTLRIDACYHFFATSTKLENLKKTTGPRYRVVDFIYLRQFCQVRSWLYLYVRYRDDENTPKIKPKPHITLGMDYAECHSYHFHYPME